MTDDPDEQPSPGIPRRRGRLGLAVAAGIAGILGVLTGVGGWTYHLARAGVCDDLPREDLSLREMGQLRRRLDAYKGDPSSPLVLSGREASFLVREQFDLPAWLAINGTEVHLEARVPRGARCWNLGFRGRIEVEEGVAWVVPASFSIGRLGLGWFVGGRRIEVPPSVVPGPEAVELLDHLDSVQIADGTMFVRIDDPMWIE